jgi:gamma-glutamylcyclotransferase (GGCT)/AIG2-like uncharacterized protein YtfP
VLIAVYGSLRKGHYNYERFGGSHSFAYKGTFQINGYKLYNLGSYPGIIEAEKGDFITVDLFECPDDVAKQIDWMETGSGYSAETIQVDGQKAIIYIYDRSISRFELVGSGDWTKYLKEKQLCADSSVT